MSGRVKRKREREFAAAKKARDAMKGRGAHSANKRLKTGKAKVTLAKAPPPPDGKPI